MNISLAILLALISAAIFALFGGWIWMICLGAFAHIFDIPKVAIGYWPSVLVSFLANILLGASTRARGY